MPSGDSSERAVDPWARQSTGVTGMRTSPPGTRMSAMAAATQPPVLGIDVGGTKVAAALIEDGQAQHGVEHPTALESSEAVIAGIEAAAREVMELAGTECSAVGLGVPSQIDFA